jgi:uncharacterized protein (DUF4213/DUF364 family)
MGYNRQAVSLRKNSGRSRENSGCAQPLVLERLLSATAPALAERTKTVILESLIDNAIEAAKDQTIRDIRAGLGYTCVLLSGGGCGLAYTFRNELGGCCSVISSAGKMIGMRASDLIPWLGDNNRLKAAMGLAAVNAALNADAPVTGSGNIVEALLVGPEDTFGMIGEFRPILAKVREEAKQVYVFERGTRLSEGCYSEEEMPRYLPECSVIVITATSLINHTIEAILPNCRNAKQVCLVGPSTPLCAKPFLNQPVTHLAGVSVKNPELLLQIVSQGGGTMSMKPAVEQVLACV